MSRRPRVSVIVPFAGAPEDLAPLVEGLTRLELAPGDEVLVAHNRLPESVDVTRGRARVLGAGRIHTPAYARNRAAEFATGEWLLFLDADTVPQPDLLARLFDPPPAPETAVLAGGIDDIAAREGPIARHSVVRRHLAQEHTMGRPDRAYATSANCAVRAGAFHAVGGFDPLARAGEDADLCFRLSRTGAGLEDRPDARVGHIGRDRLAARLDQLATHGAGAAWVNRRHRGSMPPPSPAALARRLGRDGAAIVRALTRRDAAAAQVHALDALGALAFELGRLRANRPPDSRA